MYEILMIWLDKIERHQAADLMTAQRMIDYHKPNGFRVYGKKVARVKKEQHRYSQGGV